MILCVLGARPFKGTNETKKEKREGDCGVLSDRSALLVDLPCYFTVVSVGTQKVKDVGKARKEKHSVNKFWGKISSGLTHVPYT